MYRQRSRSRSPEYRRRANLDSQPLSHDDERGRYAPRARSRSPPPPQREHGDFSSQTGRYGSPSAPQRRYGSILPSAGRYDDYGQPASAMYEDYPPAGDRGDYGRPPPHAQYEEAPRHMRHEEMYVDNYPRYQGDHRYEYETHSREWDSGHDIDRRMAADWEPQPVSGSAAQHWDGHWYSGKEQFSAHAHAPQNNADWNKRGKEPSEPSKDIIFLGLDPELTEADFVAFLRTEHNAMVEGVKIVRDKLTGASKSFGFANFQTLEGSSNFINANYPFILMPALYEHSSPRKVKVDFSTPLQNQHPGSHDIRRNPAPYVRPGHDGMRDIGSPGDNKRVLLLRGLDSLTNAGEVIYRISHEIARMMGKQGKETEAGSTIVRAVIIVDKSARSSWGYGFVELASSELASALLPFLLSAQHQPNGFLINTVPVAASFFNPASFIPVEAGPLGGEFILRTSRSGGIGCEVIDKVNGQWCAYWHGNAGAVETIPRGAPIINDGGTVELTPAHRAFLGGLAGVPLQSQGTSTQPKAVQQTGMMPINLGGSLQPITIGAGVKSRKKVEEVAMMPIMQKKNVLGDEDDDDIVGQDTVLLSRTRGARIIPPTSTSRKIASNISKWNTKQSELAAPVQPAQEYAPPKGMSDANTALGVRRPMGPETTQAVITPAAASSSPSAASVPQAVDDFDYTDIASFSITGKVACLLCQRQFKTEDILWKHVAQSDLHKTNLKDPAICQAGQNRKTATTTSGSTPASSNPTPEPSHSMYRDRAAERREAFNQPTVPSRRAIEALAASTAGYQGKRKNGPPKQSAPPPQPEVKEVGEANVGNQLLAKMGWKTGEGLGTSGDGRAEPIKVQQFENRAGLGASKGVEAGRWTGPGGWQQRAKDMTKERYNSEGGKNHE